MTPQEREIALRKKAEKKGRVVEEPNNHVLDAAKYTEPPKPRTRRTRAAK